MFKTFTTNPDGSQSHGKFVNFWVLVVATIVILKTMVVSTSYENMFYAYLLYGCGTQTINKAIDALAVKWGKKDQ